MESFLGKPYSGRTPFRMAGRKKEASVLSVTGFRRIRQVTSGENHAFVMPVLPLHRLPLAKAGALEKEHG